MDYAAGRPGVDRLNEVGRFGSARYRFQVPDLIGNSGGTTVNYRPDSFLELGRFHLKGDYYGKRITEGV